jgi:hypothetical protein
MENITMEKKSFVNELGNKILIKITETNDIGVTKQGRSVSFDAVKILIRGPTSDSENTVTWMEAIELYKALGKFIKK